MLLLQPPVEKNRFPLKIFISPAVELMVYVLPRVALISFIPPQKEVSWFLLLPGSESRKANGVPLEKKFDSSVEQVFPPEGGEKISSRLGETNSTGEPTKFPPLFGGGYPETLEGYLQ